MAISSEHVGLGFVYLLSRFRRARRTLREHEAAHDAAMAVCAHCGHPRHRHADDAQETCPVYRS